MLNERIVLSVILLTLLIVNFAGASEDTKFDISSSEWLLIPAQDESSVELKIAKYIKQKMNLKAEVQFLDDEMENMAIYYNIIEDNAPNLKLKINTIPTLKNENKIVIRRVYLHMWYVIADSLKTKEVRLKILELNNKFMRSSYTSEKVYIGKDGNIGFEASIALTSKSVPVHCEHVLNAARQMHFAWGSYYKQLAETIGL